MYKLRGRSAVKLTCQDPACGLEFITTERGQLYCNRKCRANHVKQGESRPCETCGTVNHYEPYKIKTNKHFYCSLKCIKERKEKGLWPVNPDKGRINSSEPSGEKLIRVPREGYVGKYTPERRYWAGFYLGRPLERGEVVLIINNNPEDMRRENLYVCASRSEYGRMSQGTVPWPTETNIRNIALENVALAQR